MFGARTALACWLLAAGVVAAGEARAELRGSSAAPVRQLDGKKPLTSGECGLLWHDELTTTEGYSDPRYVGAGATSCVYIAKTKGGTEVAVKVAKEKGQAILIAWKRECGDMQLLRLQACRKSQELLDLHENFLPTCLAVGEVGGLPYLVQHAAPEQPLYDAIASLSGAASKTVFAQLTAGIYAMHAIGLAHNDLHGGNIVLTSGDDPKRVALIDLGDVSSLEDAMKDTTKRDGIALWKWAEQMSGCVEVDDKWVSDAMEAAKDKFLECLKKTWSPESGFITAMGMLLDADIKQEEDQHVQEVFATDFVKDNLPALQAHYSWNGTEGCRDWGGETWENVESKARFGAHYKCETVPTYKLDPVRACSEHPSKAACFSVKRGVFWSCGSGLDPKVPCITVGLPGSPGHYYDGPCLMPGHPGHAFSTTWEGELEPEPQTVTGTVTTTTAKGEATITMTTTTTTTMTRRPALSLGAKAGLAAAKIGVIAAIIAVLWWYKLRTANRSARRSSAGMELQDR